MNKGLRAQLLERAYFANTDQQEMRKEMEKIADELVICSSLNLNPQAAELTQSLFNTCTEFVDHRNRKLSFLNREREIRWGGI